MFQGPCSCGVARSDGRGAADDLAQLRGDLGLTSAVVDQGQLLVHLAGVLGGVLHGGHARRLLGRRALEVRAVDDRAVVEVVEVLPHLVERGLEGVDVHGLGELGLVHGLGLVQRDEVPGGGLVDAQRLELVGDELQPVRVGSNDTLGNHARGSERPGNLHAFLVGAREAVAVQPLERRGALRSNDHALDRVALRLLLLETEARHLRHRRVHAAAQALVRGQRQEGDGARLVLMRKAREEVLNRADERDAVLHAPLIALQLGCRHHLHGLRDLLHGIDRAHAHLHRLDGHFSALLQLGRALRGVEAGEAVGDDRRRALERANREHSGYLEIILGP
mmetsp:Transcript_17186/g.45498  ORF Transcript_17186/g.45498 Transcript_17186/m.45498 type:complete len:335 (-) Transcript_17186:43-1047(-)